MSVTVVPSTPVVQWLTYSPLDPRFAGSIPAGVDGFFQSVKILSMTSFGREVKSWVPKCLTCIDSLRACQFHLRLKNDILKVQVNKKLIEIYHE